LMKAEKKSSNYICDKACDSYNRYKEDFDLALKLNNNAIRFGLEWARIQPDEDRWDVDAINRYRDVLAAAKKRGLTTVVTLWHWTLPVWISNIGGWENKKTIEYFSAYVDMIIKELGANIDYWVTLNEPMAPVGFGYILGTHPPAHKMKIFKARRVFKNLVHAHKNSYRQIHQYYPHAKVSITSLTDYFEPLFRHDPFSKLFVAIAAWLHHGKFLNDIKKQLDYIGLDYYFHNRLFWLPPFKFNQNERVTDMGWEIYPEGIYHILKYLAKFKKPIMILENGLADENDLKRADFIREHLYWTYRAIQEGVDVRGYFHWSLLDNFEWVYGWEPKFGLYAVNRDTMERTARPSAEVYKNICKYNKLVV
jgi:beta-glucosidase